MSHLAWLLIAPMLVLATSGQGIAQWTFTQTGGPLGGDVSSITQTVNGTIFICSLDGVFRLTDNGSTWKRVRQRTGHIDPASDATAIACSLSGDVYNAAGDGLFASRDNGETWDVLPYDVRIGYPVTQLLVDARGAVFVVEWLWKLNVSRDKGNTWSKVPTTGIPSDPGRWMVAVDSSAHLLLGTPVGLFRSPADSIEWSPTALTSRIDALYVDEAGSIFACTSEGINASTDGGDSWELRNSARVSSIAGRRTGELIFPGLLSFDGGRTMLGMEMRGMPGFVNPDARAIISEDSLLAGHNFNGVFSSKDSGRTWQQGRLVNSNIHSLCATSDNAVYAGMYKQGVYRSTDRGNQWEYAGLSEYDITHLRKAPGDILYAAGMYKFASDVGARLFVSTDHGNTWVRNHGSGWAYEIHDIAIQPDGGVWLATMAGIEFSSDRGVTWTVPLSWARFGEGRTSIAIAPNGTLFTGGLTQGLLSSSDRGVTWKHVKLDPSDSLVQTLAVHPLNGSVFASTRSAVYRSSDNGERWERVLSAPDHIREIIFDRSSALLARNGRTLFRSADDGRTWSAQTLTEFAGDLQAFAIDASDHLYLGTRGDGVFRSEQAVVGIDRVTAALPVAMKLRHYPNPASNEVTVQFDLMKPSAITIEVFNTLGTLLLSVANDRLYAAGTNSVTIPMRDLPRGVLLCRVRTRESSASMVVLHMQ